MNESSATKKCSVFKFEGNITSQIKIDQVLIEGSTFSDPDGAGLFFDIGGNINEFVFENTHFTNNIVEK